MAAVRGFGKYIVLRAVLVLLIISTAIVWFGRLVGLSKTRSKRSSFRHISVSSYPSESCFQQVPECVPQQMLAQRYGSELEVVQTYSQEHCCKHHPLIRRAVEFVFLELKRRRGIPIVLADGSALGILRHHNMQVPWTKDGDVMALVDYGDANFTSDNYEKILMSINKISKFQGKFKIEKRSQFAFAVIVDGWSALDIFIFHFSPSPTGVSTLQGEKYIQIGDSGWKEVVRPMKLKMVYPGTDCRFYDQILSKACPSKLREYIINLYGNQALFAPTKFSSGPNAGYNDVRRNLIILKKGNDIKFFLKISFVWALLVVWLSKQYYINRWKCCFLVVAPPVSLAILWMLYVSKTEPYMLDVNYWTVLKQWFSFQSRHGI